MGINLNTIVPGQLMQSRNGGKIHFAGCGQRSLYAANVKLEKGTTYEQLVNTYGTNLCQHCFGRAMEAMNVQPAAKPEPKPATDYCPGSGTRDWANGTMYPERWGYYTGNGGKCGHCGEWAGVMNKNSNPAMRRHKAK